MSKVGHLVKPFGEWVCVCSGINDGEWGSGGGGSGRRDAGEMEELPKEN